MLICDRPDSWPRAVAIEVERVADLAADHADFNADAPGYELDRLLLDESLEVELRLRKTIGSTPIQMFHATRLLEAEHDAIVREGVRPLTNALRADRLAVAVKQGLLSIEESSLLAHNGPLAWGKAHEARLGQVWGFVPLGTMTDNAESFDGLLGAWGGESISWAGHDTDDDSRKCARLVERLTAASHPVVVEIAVPVEAVPTYKDLWCVLAAVKLGMTPDQEFGLLPSRSLPVVRTLRPGSTQWDERWTLGGV